MCVRFDTPQMTLWDKEYDLEYLAQAYPNYLVPMIRIKGGRRVPSLANFGLIPYWAKDKSFGKHTYNARTETVHEKPSYRTPWRKRQFCLIPMQRFYEPNYESGKAVQWAIQRKDKALFTVAGIWDSWTDPSSGEMLESFSMLTINADGHPIMGRFHKAGDEKRSLVIINDDHQEEWLQAAKDSKPLDFCEPMSVEEFETEKAI